MLPSAQRLRSRAEFAAVLSRGRRAKTRNLAVHVLRSEAVGTDDGRARSPRAGLVVSGKVGNSVVRHRVTRRLRPLVRRELAGLAAGTDVVVRALPAAAAASSVDLGRDLRSGLAAAERKRASGSSARARSTR